MRANECKSRCDALFDMLRDGNEGSIDRICDAECKSVYGKIHQNNGDEIALVIAKEVVAIMTNDPFLTIDHCTTECDAVFDLGVPDDEHDTDILCEQSCKCEINRNFDSPECANHPTPVPSTTKHHHG
jgi:hypothetical protein